MPYEIKRRGDEHCVYKQGADNPIPGGCHATPEEAGKHKAALDAAMERRGERMAEVEAEMERRGMKPFVHEVQFGFMDTAKRIAFGVVMEPGTTDAQNHQTAIEDIETACHQTMERLQDKGGPDSMLDEHHQRLVSVKAAKIVENWIQREHVLWRATDPVTGGARETEVLPGSWCMAVKFYSDELWSEVERGEICGFSPKGWGTLSPI
jgi:hypothetical protein